MAPPTVAHNIPPPVARERALYVLPARAVVGPVDVSLVEAEVLVADQRLRPRRQIVGRPRPAQFRRQDHVMHVAV